MTHLARYISVCLLVISALLLSTLIASPSYAQAQVTPQISASEVDARIEALNENADLTEEQLKLATDLYTEAKRRLEDSVVAKERQDQFEVTLETAPETLRELQQEIETAKEELDVDIDALMKVDGDEMRQDDLIALEQALVQKESQLRTIRAELEGYRESLQAITARQLNAPKELTQARVELGQITSALNDAGEGDGNAVSMARQTNLRVRNNYRRLQITALEGEISALPKRLEIMTSRQTLADLKASKLSEEVQALQDRTGQRRLNEALQLQSSIDAQAALYADQHPILSELASRNQELAEQVRALAATESDVSRATASARSRQDIVLEDLNVAKELSKLESLDRNAGATLRRLGNQLTSVPKIRATVKTTQSNLVDATRQRLIAQEAMRDLPLGRVNAEQILERARLEDATIVDFTADDVVALQALYDSQRTLLMRIATEGTARVNDLRQLETARRDYLQATQELQTLLDEKLLWIPSVPAIGFDWAPKIFNGALELFSAEHLTLMTNTFVAQAKTFWPLILLMGVIIFALYRARPAIMADVNARAAKVGRVRQDSAWHTPSVILSGFMIAAPLPMFFLLLGALFALVEVPDPFIEGLENAFFYVAIFSFIFLTWRAWDKEKSLFSVHFKMPNDLRKAVNNELRWLIPVVGLSSGLLALTTDITTTDIYEGFSLFIFIFTALTLVFFGFKVVWWDQRLIKSKAEKGFLSRHRLLVSVFMIGGPLGAAIVAATGYYETADELLWRFFTSGVLLFMTYVVWGTIRRMIVVAQRQLRYRQAVERRDAVIKARKEKEAAEERGEEMPPPPLDTKEIDVSTFDPSVISAPQHNHYYSLCCAVVDELVIARPGLVYF